MTIRYQINLDDYINASVAQALGKRLVKNMNIIVRWGLPLLMCICIVVILGQLGMIGMICGGIISIVLAFLLIYFYPRYYRRFLQNMIKRITPVSTAQMKYEMFTDMSFSQGYYFIYFNKDECLFIPQTAFADETQKRAFFDILSQKTGIDTSALVS